MSAAREAELLAIIAAREAELAAARHEIEALRRENELLRRKVDHILRQLFGKKSEVLDPAQLELLLDADAANKPVAAGGTADAPAAEPQAATSSRRRQRKWRDTSRLEVVEEVIVPAPVTACPQAWRKIDEAVSELLDYQPGKVLLRRIVRPVYVPRNDPDGVPIKAPAPPSVRVGLDATPALLAHVAVEKFRWHQPFYRLEEKFWTRHGVRLPRNTLCGWHAVVAEILEPLYKLTGGRLRAATYLQGDETPVRYLVPGTGRTAIGYFWFIHDPPGEGRKGEIYIEWHTSRGSACLDSLLDGFRGILQTDAYAAYDTWAARREGIVQAGCWAHVRRKFHEALQGGQNLAAAPLARIQQLYRIEAGLRDERAGPARRLEVRRQLVLPLIETLKTELLALRADPGVLPKSPLGVAIDHALGIWQRLLVCCADGRVEVDNNLTENAIRPTAVGKKNWLFIGRGETGRRSAILYTMIENAVRAGHDPEAWLADVLTRLPQMTNQDDLSVLLPCNWQPPAAAAALSSADAA
jgi:transposase